MSHHLAIYISKNPMILFLQPKKNLNHHIIDCLINAEEKYGSVAEKLTSEKSLPG
jgi:hypothetical protein